MPNSKNNSSQHPEANENLEIDPNTPNSYKELLSKQENNSKKNKFWIKKKLDLSNFEKVSLDDMENILLEAKDNDAPEIKIFKAIAFIHKIETSPQVDQGIILSLLDRIENHLRSVIDELDDEMDDAINEQLELSKENQLKIEELKTNYSKIKKALMLIKNIRFSL